MPIQSTTDCRSKTTDLYGFAQALHEAFAPHLDIDELLAHIFMKSIRNITIEHGWLQLQLQWSDNMKVFWDVGAGIYNPSDPDQKYVVFYFDSHFL